MMKRAAAVLAILAGTGAAAPAASTCEIQGWGSTPRTIVRAGPSSSANVLAVLRHRAARERGEDINGTFPEFRIDAASNGWFRIGEATYGDYGDAAPSRPLFAGQGWVRGDQIGGQLYSGRLHTLPRDSSPSRPYGKDTDAVSIRRLLDCKGPWVKVEADIGTGWAKGLCSNQVTTCG